MKLLIEKKVGPGNQDIPMNEAMSNAVIPFLAESVTSAPLAIRNLATCFFLSIYKRKGVGDNPVFILTASKYEVWKRYTETYKYRTGSHSLDIRAQEGHDCI